jgi:hypothetical protein
MHQLYVTSVDKQYMLLYSSMHVSDQLTAVILLYEALVRELCIEQKKVDKRTSLERWQSCQSMSQVQSKVRSRRHHDHWLAVPLKHHNIDTMMYQILAENKRGTFCMFVGTPYDRSRWLRERFDYAEGGTCQSRIRSQAPSSDINHTVKEFPKHLPAVV